MLKKARFIPIKTLLSFVYRFYAEDIDLSMNILTDFEVLTSELSNLYPQWLEQCPSEEILEFYQCNADPTNKQIKSINSLKTKLGLIRSEDRSITELLEMIQKSPYHSDTFKHFSRIESILTTTESHENPILKNAIKYINQYRSINDTNDYRPPKLEYDTCCNDEASLKRIVDAIRSEIEQVKKIENYYFYMLDIVDRGIKLKRKFSLRDAQKLVVILTLLNEKNLLTQVATGEGKTLIITTLCIIKCLCGEKLDVITSSSVLAKRDAESKPPKGKLRSICIVWCKRWAHLQREH